MVENLSSLKENMPIKNQETYRTLTKLDQKRNSPLHKNQNPNVQIHSRIFKVVRKYFHITCKGSTIIIALAFSTETLKAGRAWKRCLRDQGD